MSSAPYEEKCQDATDLLNNSKDAASSSSKEAQGVPAQTIQNDSTTNSHQIESKPPPKYPDVVQIEEMQALSEIGRDWPDDIESESLSHLNEHRDRHGNIVKDHQDEQQYVSEEEKSERDKLSKIKEDEDRAMVKRKKDEIMAKERKNQRR
ncbi:uncharacterized protein LODBEIA_P27440 [Lodderomyces beijingensis]|uniref:Uncharacterized protein n=1 Tax=Lodderomyces beijingensis TaxID=1775926 RepID=A0ABP0ZQP2_9ASCO